MVPFLPVCFLLHWTQTLLENDSVGFTALAVDKNLICKVGKLKPLFIEIDVEPLFHSVIILFLTLSKHSTTDPCIQIPLADFRGAPFYWVKPQSLHWEILGRYFTTEPHPQPHTWAFREILTTEPWRQVPWPAQPFRLLFCSSSTFRHFSV